jgi:hypothetical protein
VIPIGTQVHLVGCTCIFLVHVCISLSQLLYILSICRSCVTEDAAQDCLNRDFKPASIVNAQVKVADRSVFKTTDAETKVAFPSLLQAAINTEVGGCLQNP